jgi:hypothetical protein
MYVCCDILCVLYLYLFAILVYDIGVQARPRAIHERADELSSGFELHGVELAKVDAGLGLLDPDADMRNNDSILAFFWEQHERRLVVCMLEHGRLGQGSRWGELDAGILRMVLGNPIHYAAPDSAMARL